MTSGEAVEGHYFPFNMCQFKIIWQQPTEYHRGLRNDLADFAAMLCSKIVSLSLCNVAINHMK